eukprot:m.237774 g.237774  ORF g.237774 m.237774 type:complete len:101 (+) comp40151_c0_seq1:163-465(+)
MQLVYALIDSESGSARACSKSKTGIANGCPTLINTYKTRLDRRNEQHWGRRGGYSGLKLANRQSISYDRLVQKELNFFCKEARKCFLVYQLIFMNDQLEN